MATIEANVTSDSIIFGPPPLWDGGEDVARYKQFHTQVLATIEPGER